MVTHVWSRTSPDLSDSLKKHQISTWNNRNTDLVTLSSNQHGNVSERQHSNHTSHLDWSVEINKQVSDCWGIILYFDQKTFNIVNWGKRDREREESLTPFTMTLFGISIPTPPPPPPPKLNPVFGPQAESSGVIKSLILVGSIINTMLVHTLDTSFATSITHEWTPAHDGEKISARC